MGQGIKSMDYRPEIRQQISSQIALATKFLNHTIFPKTD